MTIDEAGDDGEEKATEYEGKKSSRSVYCKHDDGTGLLYSVFKSRLLLQGHFKNFRINTLNNC